MGKYKRHFAIHLARHPHSAHCPVSFGCPLADRVRAPSYKLQIEFFPVGFMARMLRIRAINTSRKNKQTGHEFERKKTRLRNFQ